MILSNNIKINFQHLITLIHSCSSSRSSNNNNNNNLQCKIPAEMLGNKVIKH